MLRPPLSVPDDLPGQRLVLEGFELDLPARELRRVGARRGKRLSVKAQQVLLTLALRPGEVISREALMDAVWPDTFPTGDVLTQAIVQLRRALDDDADAPRFIETVARSGYRLLGEVRWETPQAAPAARPSRIAGLAANEPLTEAAATQPAPSRRRPWVIAAGLLLGAGVIGIAALRGPARAPDRDTALASASSVAGEPSPVVLASTPAFEHSPAVSPDGRMLVFARAESEYETSRLFLQSTGEFHARPLTLQEGVWDDSPAWSPDQQWIAFRRLDSLESVKRCEIRLVSVTSGVDRLAAECTGRPSGLDFDREGRSLILGGDRDAPVELRGLQRIDLASGRIEALPIPQPADSWDSLPRVSPDGQWILFRRGVMTADLFRAPIGGGAPEAVTQRSGDLRGHDWLGPDGAIVMSAVSEQGLQLYRVDQPGGELQPLQVVGSQPRSAMDGRRLVFEQSVTRYMLRRWDFEAAALAAPGAMSSSRSDLLPALSPDGGSVAFYSDRSGEIGLWVAGTSAESAALRVAELEPHPRFAPEWSADSRHLLVMAEGPQGRGLYEVEAASRRGRRLDVPPMAGAFGYLDQTRVLVNRRDDASYRLELYARSDGRLLSEAFVEGVGFFQVDAARQRILFARERDGSLYQTGFNLGAPGKVRDELLHPMLYRAWRVAGSHLWFMRWDPEAKGFGLWRLPLDDLGGEAEHVLPLATDDMLVFNLSLLAGARLQALWTGEQLRPQSDVAMVDLPTAAPSN